MACICLRVYVCEGCEGRGFCRVGLVGVCWGRRAVHSCESECELWLDMRECLLGVLFKHGEVRYRKNGCAVRISVRMGTPLGHVKIGKSFGFERVVASLWFCLSCICTALYSNGFRKYSAVSVARFSSHPLVSIM